MSIVNASSIYELWHHPNIALVKLSRTVEHVLQAKQINLCFRDSADYLFWNLKYVSYTDI